MKRFEHLLRKTIGLDAESIGSTSIQRAVRLRMRSLGLSRPEDYERVLQQSPAEWSEFVESVVVTETWFFRDPACFGGFVRHVLEDWLPAQPAAPMRLLSIACASGEEPYSLAMALLDAGVAPEQFQLEGVDISARALARAKQGVYGKNSFRGKDFAFRARYFQSSSEGFVLDPAVRRCVQFHQDNVCGDDFLAAHAAYDFIFCRNLLIYFDPPTQRKAVEKIERLLASTGVLFVGPVEQALVLNRGFVGANIPKASACRKAGQAARGSQMVRSSNPPPVSAAFQSNGVDRPQPPASSRSVLPPAARLSPPVPPDLEAAQRLADAGRLNEAAEICEAHLRQSRGCAQAHYLLGLVRDAGGDARAIDCYRKALYLDPNHYESLLQMALLLQKHGDPARARAFRSRAQRVKSRV